MYSTVVDIAARDRIQVAVILKAAGNRYRYRRYSSRG
jgi:hypothetical protein